MGGQSQLRALITSGGPGTGWGLGTSWKLQCCPGGGVVSGPLGLAGGPVLAMDQLGTWDQLGSQYQLGGAWYGVRGSSPSWGLQFQLGAQYWCGRVWYWLGGTSTGVVGFCTG